MSAVVFLSPAGLAALLEAPAAGRDAGRGVVRVAGDPARPRRVRARDALPVVAPGAPRVRVPFVGYGTPSSLC